MLPNKNIQNLKPYMSIPHDIWNFKNYDNVLKLDWNEATINPSPKVFEHIYQFLNSGKLNWYPNTKNIELLRALSLYTKQDSEDYIEIFGSSDAAHENIIDVFLEKNSIVCIISPTYDNFRARANGVGIKTINFMLDKNFELDFDELNNFLKQKKVDFLYICNPNNPTGVCYDNNKLEQLIINNPKIMFLVDEAYYEFCKKSVQNLVKNCKNLIITRTFSKAFALASFRIGYVISHVDNIKSINKLRNSKNISMLSQIAALAALKDVEYVDKFVEQVATSRKLFLKDIKAFDIR
ncbi:TPA: histidinol-phosphate aminotransferase family protein, partial [Campylobacter jejuni]|nr:histidinol-phosphate aminotransferase family protein [Campylobacter jejuni]